MIEIYTKLLEEAIEKYPIGTVFISPYSKKKVTCNGIPGVCIDGIVVDVLNDTGGYYLNYNETWGKIISTPKKFKSKQELIDNIFVI